MNWKNWDEARDAEIEDFPAAIQAAYKAWMPHKDEADENDASDAYCAGLKEIERVADEIYGGAWISWDGAPDNPEGPLYGLRRAAHEYACEEELY